jgi:site-specific DNA-adenine methylase
MFPEHKGYVEVFGGSAYMLFSKEPSKWEILNDFDSNLMNFWSVIKNGHEEFINSFDYTLVSRETFNRTFYVTHFYISLSNYIFYFLYFKQNNTFVLSIYLLLLY